MAILTILSYHEIVTTLWSHVSSREPKLFQASCLLILSRLRDSQDLELQLLVVESLTDPRLPTCLEGSGEAHRELCRTVLLFLHCEAVTQGDTAKASAIDWATSDRTTTFLIIVRQKEFHRSMYTGRPKVT